MKVLKEAAISLSPRTDGEDFPGINVTMNNCCYTR